MMNSKKLLKRYQNTAFYICMFYPYPITSRLTNRAYVGVAELTGIRGFLGTEEMELLALTDSTLGKLRNMRV